MRPLIADIGSALWRLLPANPIVLRVVKVSSKRLPHLWVRAGYLVILFFVLLIANWEAIDSTGSLSERAKTATRVFAAVSMLQLAMMCLISPIFAAGAISQEKDAETFNVLLTTPLTNAQIVLGSLASRMFFVIALLLSGLPIFCITMLYGGVTANQIFTSFGIAGATAILMGAVAILVSVVRFGTRGTIFGFYMGTALFLVAGIGLGMWKRTFVPESFVPATGEGMSWLAPFHPFLAQMVALSWIKAPERSTVEHYPWPLDEMAASPQTSYMVITLLVSVLLVGLATFFVRHGIRQGEVSFLMRLSSKVLPRKKDGERHRRARRVWSNPVAWREAITRASAASGSFARYSYIIGGVAAAAILLYMYHRGDFAVTTNPPNNEARSWLSVIVMIEFVAVMLMATNTAATAITRERESGTMELLLTTPLTSRYIVWGKLRGLVSFTIPLLAVPALTVFVAAMYDFLAKAPVPIATLESALLLPALMLVYSAFSCMLGLHMSLKSKRSVQAVVSSLAILLVVGFGLFMCALAAQEAANLAALIVPLTFVAAIWMVLNPDTIDRAAGMSGYQLDDITVFMFIGTLLAIAVFGGIVAGTYRSMVTNFDMIVRKQSR